MRKQQQFNQEESKRQHVIAELKKLGITETGSGEPIRGCTYQELKWHLAFVQAVREVD